MIVAVALIAILTPAITSTFVEAAQRRRRASDEARDRESIEALHAQHEEILSRLVAIEAALATRERGPDATAPPDDRAAP